MNIFFWIMFVITLIVAITYCYKYEKECNHSYELEDKLCEMKYLKNRMLLNRIIDLVNEYKHGKNVFTVMRDISETTNKIELESD